MGGGDGFPALVTDQVYFGIYLIDFDQDEDSAPSVWEYHTEGGPWRPSHNGAMEYTCALYNERWGHGANYGRLQLMLPGDISAEDGGDGMARFSNRGIASFPAHFNFNRS